MSAPDIARILSGITGAYPAAIYNLAKDDALPADEWPLAQRIEQPRCCKYCENRNLKIVAKSNPQYALHLGQFHMNCRGFWVDIHRDEGHEEIGPDGKAHWVKTKPDWGKPDKELQKKYAHFIHAPEKYAPLNVPARPTGRDFIFYPGRNGEPSTMVFAPALPDAMLRATLHRIAMPIAQAIFAGNAPYAADANILKQCARQSANRKWFDHQAIDTSSHSGDWGYSRRLSPDEYADLPGDLLNSDPWVAVCNYDSDKAGLVPSVVFHAPSVQAGQAALRDVSMLWDIDRATFWHPGRLRLGNIMNEQDFVPLTGGW